ncbi:HicA toxin of bacterial toxin-antitoxin [uncultured archaeon]|nr:HicA toxin of bacterial toxin-antitoxin [uncultured archaeon]
MPKLNPISADRFVKFLEYVGCSFVSQKGSHKKFWRSDLNRPIIVPIHAIDLPIFVIKNALRVLKIDNEQYLQILEKEKI